MKGQLYRYDSMAMNDHRSYRHLFIHNEQNTCKRGVVVLIPGLTDGIYSLPWTDALAKLTEELEYALVMPNLSSSFDQFGFRTLKQDAEDIRDVVCFLTKTFDVNTINFIGHSTGCQIVATYLRELHSSCAQPVKVNNVILHGAVSDYLALKMYPSVFQELMDESLAVTDPNHVLRSHRVFGAPLTAERFRSFCPNGADDMFTPGLSEEYLKDVLRGVKHCQSNLILIYCTEDECVPSIDDLKAFAEGTLTKVLQSSIAEGCKLGIRYIPGDHTTRGKNIDALMEEIRKGLTS